MEWQQIIGFYHVVKLQSFTRAAEATFRTQSALSQQIKALEKEFECPLFERAGKRKPRLTSAGESFLHFAELVLQGSEHLKDDLEAIKGNRRGHLKIAAPFTTLYHLFPGIVRQYASKFPQVELTLLDRPQQMVIDLVRNGDIDFGFTLENLVPGSLSTIRWKQVETVVIVPVGHPLCAMKRVSLKQLAKYPLILPPGHLHHRGRMLLEKEFQKKGLDYRIVMESSNIELSSVYVESGLGVSCGSIIRDLPQLKMRKLDFLSLGHLFGPEHIAVVMRKDKAPAHYKQAFIKSLFEEESAADSKSAGSR
ncbi:Transcriptional regulator [Syntrophobacter sp. SbD1]|nr:Transcriptional regulator [Syntrophobacter sp. SbD1]